VPEPNSGAGELGGEITKGTISKEIQREKDKSQTPKTSYAKG